MLVISTKQRLQGITVYTIGERSFELKDMVLDEIDALATYIIGFTWKMSDDDAERIASGGGMADIVATCLGSSKKFISGLMTQLFHEEVTPEWVGANIGPRDIRAAGKQLLVDNDVQEIYNFAAERLFPFFQEMMLQNTRKNMYELPEGEDLP